MTFGIKQEGCFPVQEEDGEEGEEGCAFLYDVSVMMYGIIGR
jgi:hypothetical protein